MIGEFRSKEEELRHLHQLSCDRIISLRKSVAVLEKKKSDERIKVMEIEERMSNLGFLVPNGTGIAWDIVK